VSADRDPSSELTRKQRRERAREERRAHEAALVRAAATRRRLRVAGGVTSVGITALAVVLVATGGGSGATVSEARSKAHLKLAPLASLGSLRAAGAPGPRGPEGVPIPAAQPAATTATIAHGQNVDGIQCSGSEQTLFHIHAHLTIFVDGVARQVPMGIGIPDAVSENTPEGPFVASGTCFYWLHTHAADGIIHIESPVERVFTLGDFFDEWGQPLGPDRVGSANGPVTAIYNGRRDKGDPRDIPLTAHAQIQLEVGRPLVAPAKIEFPNGL
jgi:hypothetical protein